MDLSTNIIRNVYNIGTGACDTGTQYCSDGYALYFPCLKDITKGQDVCFDFYLVDMAGRSAYVSSLSNQDGSPSLSPNNELADLRDVDGISLNLIGMFNCPYGTFSYPNNISSLQLEEYPLVYEEDFGERKPCTLSVIKCCDDDVDVDSDSKILSFYSGTTITLNAIDTENYIFVGWYKLREEDDEECPDETMDDFIDSKNSTYTFTIQENTIIIAIYRKRESYSVIVDSNNKSSWFKISYRGEEYDLWNRDGEIFDEIESSVSGIDHSLLENVLEGYHMAVWCVPSSDEIGNSDDDSKSYYKFDRWSDMNTDNGRLFEIGKDTKAFEKKKNFIALKAKCSGPVDDYSFEYNEIPYADDFDNDDDGIYIKIKNTTPYGEDNPYVLIDDYDDSIDDEDIISIYDFCGDSHTISADEVYQKYVEEKGYAYFNQGTLVLSSAGIVDGIKICIHAKSDDSCKITVTVNGTPSTQIISTDEFNNYEYYFSRCNQSNIIIKSNGECLIDKIEVYREKFTNKGKAQFCLDAETTANLPSGKISVNGAVVVNKHAYGLATTQIGNVNKLPKIRYE